MEHLVPSPDGNVTAAAPRDGTVFEVQARMGQAVLPGTPVVTMEKLVVDLRFYRVGDIVQIEVDRGGEIRTIDVNLLARPENV